MVRGLKIRDTKENMRLAEIADHLTDLKILRQLCKDNREHLAFLLDFREAPIFCLEQLGVERLISETVFILDGVITPELLESFRKTKSRKFWE